MCPYLRIRSFRSNWVKMRSSGIVGPKPMWLVSSWEKRHRDRQTRRGKTSCEDSCKPRSAQEHQQWRESTDWTFPEPVKGAGPRRHFDFRLLEVWENKFLFSKSPSLWHCDGSPRKPNTWVVQQWPRTVQGSSGALDLVTPKGWPSFQISIGKSQVIMGHSGRMSTVIINESQLRRPSVSGETGTGNSRFPS